MVHHFLTFINPAAQFVKGFGGIGGILRYKVDFTNLATLDEEEDEFYSDDDI